jgi:energy-coupling factor transporter ATP-binding protein EcfA2
MASVASAAIDLRGVTKTFGALKAVDNLDLTVPRGAIYGFIGPNGAGKTTTIRMIMAILLPDAGELGVLGRRSALEAEDRIGYLPEERGVYRKMKVAAYLSYIARLKGVPERGLRERVRAPPAAVREIAGARYLVERLLATPGVRVAVATGGWEETARLKLAHVGIDVASLGFASSSDARVRTEIMRLAAQRAMRGAAFGRATYFGDGPWDRRASAELGYEFVAVGNAVAHDVAYADLRDTEAILARLEVATNEGVKSA